MVTFITLPVLLLGFLAPRSVFTATPTSDTVIMRLLLLVKKTHEPKMLWQSLFLQELCPCFRLKISKFKSDSLCNYNKGAITYPTSILSITFRHEIHRAIGDFYGKIIVCKQSNAMWIQRMSWVFKLWNNNQSKKLMCHLLRASTTLLGP